jgi:ADP-ribose pyrophosphatase
MQCQNKLIVHGLIEYEGYYLIIKRSKIKRGAPNFYPEYWDIPGGTVENEELPRNALLREIMEETGLRARIETIIHEDSNLDIEKNTIFTRLVYRCSICDFANEKIILDPEEHSEYDFIEKIHEKENVVPYLLAILTKKRYKKLLVF